MKHYNQVKERFELSAFGLIRFLCAGERAQNRHSGLSDVNSARTAVWVAQRDIGFRRKVQL